MDRLDVDQSHVEDLRTEVSSVSTYVGKSTPLPGSVLKLDDDVTWLDLFPMRVLWGYETPDYFFAYCPDMDESYLYFDASYITDRAPLDPNETPMPIYPEQQAMRGLKQAPESTKKAKKHDKKAALQHLLKQLNPAQAKKVRALVKAKRPELLEGEA